MNIKIYYQNKTIWLTNDMTPILAQIQDPFIVYQLEAPDGADMMKTLLMDENESMVFFAEDMDNLKNHFFSNFNFVQAAGGIVVNQANQVLWMYRREHWDLPKGKLDEGESIENCAAREILEETGVNGLQLQQHLLQTYHIYPEKGKLLLKETHWFYFTTQFSGVLQPQTTEDIEQLVWTDKTDTAVYFAKTYPSIRDVYTVFQSIC